MPWTISTVNNAVCLIPRLKMYIVRNIYPQAIKINYAGICLLPIFDAYLQRQLLEGHEYCCTYFITPIKFCFHDFKDTYILSVFNLDTGVS